MDSSICEVWARDAVNMECEMERHNSDSFNSTYLISGKQKVTNILLASIKVRFQGSTILQCIINFHFWSWKKKKSEVFGNAFCVLPKIAVRLTFIFWWFHQFSKASAVTMILISNPVLKGGRAMFIILGSAGVDLYETPCWGCQHQQLGNGSPQLKTFSFVPTLLWYSLRVVEQKCLISVFANPHELRDSWPKPWW